MLASIEEATAAYREADGDANKAVNILAVGLENASSSSSMSSGISGMDWSSTTSSEGFKELMAEQVREFRGKEKELVDANGTVSAILRKDYVSSNGKKSGGKGKEMSGNAVKDREEVEQFLCSMLGDEPELSLVVVSDVLLE